MSTTNTIEERICFDCDNSIAHRSISAIRCEDCVLKMKKIYDKNCHDRYKEAREIIRMKIPRNCIDCDDCIKHLHGNSILCKDCAYERELKNKRSYWKKSLSLKIPEEKFCLDCETYITGTHGGTKCCKDCYKKRSREKAKVRYNKEKDAQYAKNPKICPICRIDISGKHSSAKHCKKCAADKVKSELKIRIEGYRQDPDYRAAQTASAKERTEKLRSTPEGKAKHREMHLKSQRKARSTPEGREKLNAQNRASRIKNSGSTKSAISNRMIKKHRREKDENIGPLPSKQKIFDNQLGICPYTGISMKNIPINELHLDHIVPLANGGKNTPENLCLTFPCANLSKGSKSLLVWMASPLYRPIAQRCTEETVG